MAKAWSAAILGRVEQNDGDALVRLIDESLNAPRDPNDRECEEYLICPACAAFDLDFEFIEYRVVRCYSCKALVRVTHYDVHLGPPEDPTDHVGYRGVVATSP